MSAISNTNTLDIIFCRNVLMYFTPGWISKIANSFYQDLTKDGWFVVSSCELSSQVFPQFTAINFPGAVLYRKGKNGIAHSLPIEPSAKVEFPITPSPLCALAESKLHFDLPITPSLPHPITHSSIREPQTITEETSTDKIYAIRLLADQGHLEEALSLCTEAIGYYKLTPGLYFLRASILQELDKSAAAIASLKQAIYIDPDYTMGYFTLGNLYNQQGNGRNAKRYFNNVLDLLRRCSNEDILPESGGLSAEYLREIIISNMDTIRTK
jgi:chemotaxis protein methyltransferase CheR